MAIVLAAFLWSLDGLLRTELFSLPPSVIVFWEHALGIFVLIPFLIYYRGRYKPFTKNQWKSIVTVSFLSGALGTILYTAALTRTMFAPFSVVVLLQQLQPIFAISAAAILLKEKVNQKFIGLAALALIAAYFTAFPDLKVNFDTGADTAMAALFAVGAAAAWGVSTALSKYSLKGVNSVQTTATRFAIVPFFALAFAFILGDSSELTSITGEQWKYLIAITFSTGLLALSVYYYGLKRVMASRSTILELTWPVSAVAVGFLFRDETFTATQWIGAIALTAIIYTIVRSQKDKPE